MNSLPFLKGGPLPVLVPCGLLDLPCARLDLFGPVFVPCRLVDPSWTRIGSFVNHCSTLAHLWIICGFLGALMYFWLDHCWTVLDSCVISSLGFQFKLFVSLPCSEGLEWVLSLEISAGFIGWKFGWLESVKNGRFTRFKSFEGESFVAEA